MTARGPGFRAGGGSRLRGPSGPPSALGHLVLRSNAACECRRGVTASDLPEKHRPRNPIHRPVLPVDWLLSPFEVRLSISPVLLRSKAHREPGRPIGPRHHRRGVRVPLLRCFVEAPGSGRSPRIPSRRSRLKLARPSFQVRCCRHEAVLGSATRSFGRHQRSLFLLAPHPEYNSDPTPRHRRWQHQIA